jgi:hypothetical protein
MTLLEELQAQLQRAEETRGSDAPVTRMIRQEIEDLKRRLSSEKSPTEPDLELLNYHVGFRKAKH